MKNGYKRRNYFIKKDFQGKLILGYFLFVTIGCVLFALIIAVFSADTMTIVYQNNNLQFGQTPIMLLKKVIAAHWVFLLTGGSLLVFAAMLITHRLAGPMFRFEKALDNMIDGCLDDTIYLRKKDEGKELAKKINTFNKKLSEQMGDIQRNAKSIDDLMVQYELLDPENMTFEDCNNIYKVVKGKNEEIIQISNSFILKDND